MSYPINTNTITRNEVRPGKVKFTADLPLIKKLAVGHKRFLVDKIVYKRIKSLRVVINGKEHCLPNSQVTVGIEARDGKKLQVIDVPNWLVRDRNLQ